jgi:phosphatidate cytidylyltransferase
MLKQRIITAAILIPVTLLIIFFLPNLPFAILTGVLMLFGALEWTNLMGLKRASHRALYLLIAVLVSFAVLFVPVLYLLTLSFLWWLCALMLIVIYPRGSKRWGAGRFWPGVMGLLVLIPCWGSVNFIRNQFEGAYILLYVFLLIWGADSVAYFVGKKWGKTKLAPHVSPGKSLQGFMGATIFGMLFAIVSAWICDVPVAMWPNGVCLSLLTVWFSVVGDLTESMMKRHAGVKDSGNLLPGHGGLLDRIDSLTAAGPVFALGALLIGA